ncbi:MAG TPA: AbrB/MazE/SpoVT family DNA-binding domain-containing protein [Candidatus Bathyarchaeia archaeon]|nr:AbrB/MazE/SpoVT family DNA-binding domain-containing protein [Candidatus Bathyarchaeia archaeon]
MGAIIVGTATIDEKGRVLIPIEDRIKHGLKPGVRLEVRHEREGLRLIPILPEPVRVKARRKWGPEAFLDAGDATFGE